MMTLSRGSRSRTTSLSLTTRSGPEPTVTPAPTGPTPTPTPTSSARAEPHSATEATRIRAMRFMRLLQFGGYGGKPCRRHCVPTLLLGWVPSLRLPSPEWPFYSVRCPTSAFHIRRKRTPPQDNFRTPPQEQFSLNLH